MSSQSDPKVVITFAAVLALAGMGAGVFFVLAAPQPEPAMAEKVVHPPKVVRNQPPARPASSPSVERPPPAADSGSASPGSASPKPARSRMARDLKREQIWTALRREHALEPATEDTTLPSPEAAAQLPALDPEYIQTAIREQLVPVAIECYQSALEDQPELAGQLVMNFTIVGAEEVGGVVEEAGISEDSTLDNPFVRECMRESLLAVTFEPPADGGRVEVNYPFVFAPEEPE